MDLASGSMIGAASNDGEEDDLGGAEARPGLVREEQEAYESPTPDVSEDDESPMAEAAAAPYHGPVGLDDDGLPVAKSRSMISASAPTTITAPQRRSWLIPS